MGIYCSKPPADTSSAVLPLQLSPRALSIWGLCPGAAGEVSSILPRASHAKQSMCYHLLTTYADLDLQRRQKYWCV